MIRRNAVQPCYLCAREPMHRLISDIPICEPCLEHHDLPIDAPPTNTQAAFANQWNSLGTYDGE